MVMKESLLAITSCQPFCVYGKEVRQQQAFFIKLIVEFQHFFEFGRSWAERPFTGIIIVAKESVVTGINKC